ncbi:MAG: hypothetical protein HY742_09550 [Deltaproteobacteria bacterium]|nr:hypothetical protein [Deltaproteobacteria bacterium]
MKQRRLHLSMFCVVAVFFALFELAGAADNPIIGVLDKDIPYAMVSPDLFGKLGEDLKLPDGGKHIKELADKAPGGAFDPRDMEKIPSKALGYKAKWSVIRYTYYGLDWDITGLRLESLDSKAKKLPWLVIINGGSANFYEFFIDPFNRPGLGQYLAQKINVLLVTIPGNFKYGGWELPPSQRAAQYLLDKDLSPEENKARNAIYTNRMEIEGLKRLILKETSGDILITGHSTSGELAFLSMGEKELARRLKGRFLGWGSGGPSNLRKEWEEKVGKREKSIKELSQYPPLWKLRTRDAEGYVNSGYIGPLNPCGKEGMKDLEVAEKWLSKIERNRPNFKQVLQDLEHRGMVELRSKLEGEMKEALSATTLPVKLENVSKDLFATNNAPITGYKKMVWVNGKWDEGHWHKTSSEKARELTIANQFRERNPQAAIRILVFDLPMTHYGHIEKPREVAGGLIAAVQWLAK